MEIGIERKSKNLGGERGKRVWISNLNRSEREREKESEWVVLNWMKMKQNPFYFMFLYILILIFEGLSSEIEIGTDEMRWMGPTQSPSCQMNGSLWYHPFASHQHFYNYFYFYIIYTHPLSLFQLYTNFFWMIKLNILG